MPYLTYLLLSVYSFNINHDKFSTDYTATSAKLSLETDSLHHIAGADTAQRSSVTFKTPDYYNFEDSLRTLYNTIGLNLYELPFDVFRYGMIGYYTLRAQEKLACKNIISIIDFTKPSTQKRFYTIDLTTMKVKYYTYVSHGKNTGENIAKTFSNELHSNQSSLGFYITGETYIGSKGYSLKLDGTEKGYNDNMRTRAVVMHDADYVSENWIKKNGRLGRSQGCPALPKEIAKEVIDEIKNQTLIFAFYNDFSYLNNSPYLNVEKLFFGSDVSAKR